jgi:hypothetical protein
MIKKLSNLAMISTMLFGIGVVANAQGSYRQDGYGNRQDSYGQYNEYQRNWSRERTREFAFLLGYHQSYSEGRDLREQGYRGNVKNTPGYRNDTNGYMAWMNFESDYRDRYRRGYEEGFRDAQSLRERRYDRDDVERVLGARLKEVYGDGSEYDNDRWGRGRDNNDDRWGRDRDNNDDRWGRDNNRNRRYDRQEIYRLAQQQGYQAGLRRGQEDRRSNRRNEIDRNSDYRDGMQGYRSEYGDRNAYQQGYREGFRRGYEEGFRNGRGNGRWPF